MAGDGNDEPRAADRPEVAAGRGAADNAAADRTEGPTDDGADDPEATYRRCSDELVEALDHTVGGWVERIVADLQVAWSGELPPAVEAAGKAAAEAARAEVVAGVRRLVALDVEAQTTNPLSLLRAAVRHPTAVLAGAGVPEVVRDDFAERAFPADVYDLSPAAFADVDPDLAEPGLRWGAAKALVVLTRRRRRP